MEQSKFLSVAIAACLLFCSADVFAQRSRAGSGSSSGRVELGHRSVKSSYSSSGSKSVCSSKSRSNYYVSPPKVYQHYDDQIFNHNETLFNKFSHGQDVNYGSSQTITTTSSLFDVFSNSNVLNSYFPVYGYEVGKRTATKESLFIPRASGDFYYRDGVFFSKSLRNDRKYVIDRPCCGIRVPDIPASRREYKVNDITYYSYYGTFYIYDASTSEYVVVTPPVGLVVNSLPAYAMKIVVNDDCFYIVDNVVYKAILSEGKCKYVVTKLESNEMHQIKERIASAK